MGVARISLYLPKFIFDLKNLILYLHFFPLFLPPKFYISLFHIHVFFSSMALPGKASSLEKIA